MKDRSIHSEAAQMNVIQRKPAGFWRAVSWLFWCYAQQWRKRARFYERYRDYFPRLSASRFVKRCRELEHLYGKLASMVLVVPVREHEWVPIRVPMGRRKGRRISGRTLAAVDRADSLTRRA
ncbi:MAG: hypothetical protein NNA23_12120 [Nitrospira sp.]|nr:hypothetical protein [Nitrospira sp.]